MTVCIAAKSFWSNQIITVSDMKVVVPGSSMDAGTLKSRSLSRDHRWGCLFSTGDLPRIESLHRRICDLLSAYDSTISLPVVESAVRTGYESERQYLIGEILKTMNFPNIREFELEGLARLDVDRFNAARHEIDTVTADIEMLVYGFDEVDRVHIFSVTTQGRVYSDDGLGFGAVGTGAEIVMKHLLRDERFRFSKDLGDAIYRLCEAKFVSEMDDFVGEATHVTILSLSPLVSGGIETIVSDGAIAGARALWERRRKQRTPERIAKRLTSGETSDKDGRSLRRVAMICQREIADHYASVTSALSQLRAEGRIDDDQWSRIEIIYGDYAALDEDADEMMKEWKMGSESKPEYMDRAIAHLRSTVEWLQRIAAAHAAPPSD